MARQHAHLRGGVLCTVCGALLGALSLRDTRGGAGWEGRGLQRHGADAPRGRERSCPAVGVARAARSPGTLSRGAPDGSGGPRASGPPRGPPRGGWATGRARGHRCSRRSMRRAGALRAAQPRAPWRRGTARPCVWIPWERVASRGRASRSRRCSCPGTPMVQ
jgi:hypothetical protein